MHARPLSVTIAGWFLIISAFVAGAGILYLNMGGGWPTPAAVAPTLYWAVTIGSVLVTLLCGIFVLRGADWARWLFIIWSVATIVLDLVTAGGHWTVYLNIVLLALIAWMLFRKPASDWFAGRSPAPVDESPAPDRD